MWRYHAIIASALLALIVAAWADGVSVPLAIPQNSPGAAVSYPPISASAPTWDPSNKGSPITLSNGNLTATQTSSSGTNYSVRTTTSHSSGLYYFEFSFVAAVASSTIPFGFVNSAAPVTGPYQLGVGDTNSVGFTYGSSVYYNSAIFGSNISYGSPSRVAIDITGQQIWVASGSGNWNNNPSASPGGTGGFALPSVSGALYIAMSGYDVNDETTLCLNAGCYVYSLPAGASNW